jgi:hypothetical protein
LMYDRTPGGIPESKTGISGEPFLHKYTNWCVCVLGHPAFRRSELRRRPLRNGINLTDPPIPRGYR